MLSGKQKRFLRGEASVIKPAVFIGKEGLTQAVIEETDKQLLSSELLKVRVQKNFLGEIGQTATALAQASQSQVCGQVGRVFILYRRNPDKPEINLP